ncbi:hypothetical protein [Algoriphagus sp.]|uniref:hypothetical protein n=1 Tax=Algoriphagus sp. TaxID=1872435 RepID=UPI0026310B62|nr:hypothetical protein [Algoriphagus sp.]
MKHKAKITSLLSGIGVGALSYWFQPYNSTLVFGVSSFLIQSMGTFLVAFILLSFLKEKPSKIALFTTLGVLLGVFLRIFYDITFWDSTSHNLFPFELLLVGLLVLPSALLGAYLGFLVFQKFWTKS